MLLCQGVYQFPWENSRAGSVLTCNKKVVQTRGLRSSTTAVQWAGDAINKRWVDSDRDQQIFCAPMYFLPYFWPICNWQHPLVTAVQLTRMSSKNLHASFIRLPNAHLLSSSLMQLDCPAAPVHFSTLGDSGDRCYLPSFASALMLSLTCSRSLFYLFSCQMLVPYPPVLWKTEKSENQQCHSAKTEQMKTALTANRRK